MSDGSLLERNLLSLSLSDPGLAARVRDAGSSHLFRLEASRTGQPVPAVLDNGYLRYLHSRVDPVREGSRLAEECASGEYIISFGLGGGYLARALLSGADISGLLILDTDMSFLRSTMESLDLHALLIDPRVRILVDPEPAELRTVLTETYLPAVCGTLRTISLRGRTSIYPEKFETLAEMVRATLEEVADDYTVQSYFGKRWFSNMIANLPDAADQNTTIRPHRTAWIAAAGPSLEDQIPLLDRAEDAMVISTDTALYPLLAAGIEPDIVISIDCQHVSYHHFLRGYPAHAPLLLDLASPPGISRRVKQRAYFTSGHPFARYVSENMRHFPTIDTSGGNVTHAAVSLAHQLGAREIRVLGADFSYPDGKPYARGTYLYPYFASRANRLQSEESLFFSFLCRGDHIERDKTPTGIRYTTRPLLGYKGRLESLISAIDARVVSVPGRGLPVAIPAHRSTGSGSLKLFAPGPVLEQTADFLRSYREDVASLPIPGSGWGSYVADLAPEQRTIVITILPAAAAIRRSASPDTDEWSLPELLGQTVKWIMATLDRALTGIGQGQL